MANRLLGRVFGGEEYRVPGVDWWLPASVVIWHAVAVLLGQMCATSVIGQTDFINSSGYSWLFCGVVWLAWFVRYRDRTAWPRLARRLGFNFLARANEANIQAFPPLVLWQDDDLGRLEPLLGGRGEGIETLIFNWQAGPVEGVHNRTTVIMLATISKRLPDFCLKPRVWEEGSPEFVEPCRQAWNDTFRRNYRVEGLTSDESRACFASRVMAYFAQHPTWTIESCDGWLAVYRPGQRLEPWQVEDRLNKAVEILRLLIDNVGASRPNS